MRKTKKPCSDTIDGVSDDIPGHFKSIYEDLYNCVEDADEIADIKVEVENKITKEALKDVKKVTPEEVMKASASLKPGKGDPEYTFSPVPAPLHLSPHCQGQTGKYQCIQELQKCLHNISHPQANRLDHYQPLWRRLQLQQPSVCLPRENICQHVHLGCCGDCQLLHQE